MTSALHWVALALYAFSAAVLAVSLARSARSVPRAGTWILAGAVAAHAASLGAFVVEHGEPPLVGLGPSLSVLAFLVAVGSLGVATLARTGPLGLVLVPVAAAIAAVAQVVGIRPAAEAIGFRGPWFIVHVVLAMVAYAGLAVAYAAGLMYLLQFRELKSKRFGPVFRFFPPLDTLDRIGRAALLVGLPALTASLVVGWAWSERFGQPLEPGNPKVVWGVITWLALAAALGVRVGEGRRARRTAVVSVAGFVVVVLAYLLLRVGEAPGGGFL